MTRDPALLDRYVVRVSGARGRRRGARRRGNRRSRDRSLARRGRPRERRSRRAAARRFFERRYRAAGTPARAAGSKAYLKSDLQFYGTTMADIRGAANEFAREHPDLTRARAARRSSTSCGRRMCSSSDRPASRCCRSTPRCSRRRDLPWLLGFVRLSKTWAHVDWLAADVIGGVVGESRTALRRLPAWARDDNFWVRRTALLAQLRHAEPRGAATSRCSRVSRRRCSANGSSSSARRSAGCCAR